MPPKVKVTKEMISNTAFEIVRREGLEALSVRTIAKELGCSTQPVFSNFNGMDEIKKEVIRRADLYYTDFQKKEVENSAYPSYKASGIGYIHFAKYETQLFRLLFMRDRSAEGREEADAQEHEFTDAAAAVREQTKTGEKTALDIHAAMWVFVHGIASMIATSYLEWDDETVSDMLTTAYRGVCGQLIQKEET